MSFGGVHLHVLHDILWTSLDTDPVLVDISRSKLLDGFTREAIRRIGRTDGTSLTSANVNCEKLTLRTGNTLGAVKEGSRLGTR